MYLGVAEKDQIYSMQEPDKTPELFESYSTICSCTWG